MGFQHILVGAGTAAELVPAIAANLEPAAGVLVYLSGQILAFDLERELAELGFRVERYVVYSMQPATSLSPETIDLLQDDKLDGVILLSPQTAKIFVRLILRHRLQVSVRRLRYFCLSEAVASELSALDRISTTVPERPVLAELLAQIELTAAQWGE
jgi:uroporphyrinogen-III synthase